jgi:methylmalonyl-CoA/ethylmalonyl-CoA epimerase
MRGAAEETRTRERKPDRSVYLRDLRVSVVCVDLLRDLRPLREPWATEKRIEDTDMKATLDHVGIAVSDLDAALTFYRDALGLEIDAPEDVASQRVRAHFVPVGESAIELLEATADDSPIARYIAKRGPGLHHITLRVEDIRVTLARLKARGVRLIDEEPRPGAHGSLVAFVHPASTHGVLVELKERVDHPRKP